MYDFLSKRYKKEDYFKGKITSKKEEKTEVRQKREQDLGRKCSAWKDFQL